MSKTYTLNDLHFFAKDTLSPDRYTHTTNVIKAAQELCERYEVDFERAKIAALLHDITKEYSKAQHYSICEKYNITLTEQQEQDQKLLHATTGSAIAKYKLSIEDEEILSAISCHTTAKANMTKLEKVIYLADFIEQGRDFEGVVEIRKNSFRDLDVGILTALKFSITELIYRGKPIEINTVKAYNEIIITIRKRMGFKD